MEHGEFAFTGESVLFPVSFEAVRGGQILLDLLQDQLADFMFFHFVTS